MGSLLAVGLVFVSFLRNKEGYPFETSTDDKYFFSFVSYNTMNNRHKLKYRRTALRLIRRHERCSRKLARYNSHLTFLTRCIKSHIIPRDLRVQPPVPTKGARKVAKPASMRFLRERIRLTQRAKGDAKRETESRASGITAALTR